MLLVTYQRRPAALAGASQFYLTPEIDELPSGHPLKTFVCFLALYARDVQTGALPGDPNRYRPLHAERYAREALVPAPEFLAVQDRSDHQLAGYFGVPPDQISRRREDFAGKPQVLMCRRRWRDTRRWCQR